MTDPASVRVEHARTREDWGFVRRICCETGNDGESIDPARWPFFSENWVGPYQRLEPDWGYIAYAGGNRAGYLLGCPNALALHSRRFLRFQLPLSLQIAAGRHPRNADTRRFLRRAFHLEKGPEESFPPDTLQRLHQEFPAHLHMNVDSKFRSLGLGHHLVDAYKADLRKSGIPGIHLFCGEKPLKFYGREGFNEIARIEFRPGVWVYSLGART